jgi:hypothetical protein
VRWTEWVEDTVEGEGNDWYDDERSAPFGAMFDVDLSFVAAALASEDVRCCIPCARLLFVEN